MIRGRAKAVRGRSVSRLGTKSVTDRQQPRVTRAKTRSARCQPESRRNSQAENSKSQQPQKSGNHLSQESRNHPPQDSQKEPTQESQNHSPQDSQKEPTQESRNPPPQESQNQPSQEVNPGQTPTNSTGPSGRGESTKPQDKMATPPMPVFKGTSDRDPGMWFNKFVAFALANEWDDDKWLVQFPNYLDEAAFRWWDSLNEGDNDTVAKVTAAFEARFVQGCRYVELEKYEKRTVQPGEAIETYVEEKVQMGKRLEKSDRDILDGIVNGLSPHLKNVVVQNEAKSVQEVIQCARRALAVQPSQETKVCACSASNVSKQDIETMLEEKFKAFSLQSVNVAQPVPQSYQHPGQIVSSGPQHSDSQVRYSGRPRNSYRGRPSGQYRGSYRHSNRPSGNGINQQSATESQTSGCQRCGETGHNKYSCDYRYRFCELCGRKGHKVTTCYRATQPQGSQNRH